MSNVRRSNRAASGLLISLAVGLLLFTGATALSSPPAGRPPVGPLARYDPVRYELGFEVAVRTRVKPYEDPAVPPIYHLEESPIMFPVILHGAYSRVNGDSIHAQLRLGDGGAVDMTREMNLEGGHALNSHLVTIPVKEFRGHRLRWRIEYEGQSWSSRLNDAGAGELSWPREWPAEVRQALEPQMFIESDEEIFRETIERISEGQLRLVPPHYAAKDILRYTIEQVQIDRGAEERGDMGVLRGLTVQGALKTAETQRGSPHDLVCICVAMLRAAEIPARAVIGIERPRRPGTGGLRIVSWGEYYLEGAGWVPFDPMELRRRGVRHRDVRDSWPGVGTIDDLNERMPLAYHFIPPRQAESPEYPAVWGWQPKPGSDPGSRQEITLRLSRLGKGEPDPE